MCLAIPARVIAVDENRRATVDMGGVRREASLAMVPEAGVDDYVLIHAGYAIQKLDEAEARETLDLLSQLAEAADEELRRAQASG